MTCPVCRTEFKPRRSTTKTCSRACRGKWIAEVRQPQRLTTRQCGRCGADVRALGGRTVYCEACRSPERACAVCGASFRSSDRRVRVCSFACRSRLAATAQGHSEGHPNWKGGGDPYHTHAWHRRRDEVRERDGWTCVDCGKPRSKTVRLHAHHLVARKDWGDRPGHPDDADNLVTVCTGCHRKRHPLTFAARSAGQLRRRAATLA